MGRSLGAGDTHEVQLYTTQHSVQSCFFKHSVGAL